MQLVIGNKNYSSWSMRPWVLMRQAGIAFDEIKLPLGDMAPDSEFKRRLAGTTPAGRVPVLVLDDGSAVWDTLAIAETLAEHFPQHRLWPDAPRQRALARSLCAEMHAGFGALRNHCPMNIEAALQHVGPRLVAEQPGVQADLARLVAMWSGLLQAHAEPMLFGRFTIADAYFAPVCMRIRTYGLPVPPRIAAYVEAVSALPATQQWMAEALTEHDFVMVDEPYRAAPAPQ